MKMYFNKTSDMNISRENLNQLSNLLNKLLQVIQQSLELREVSDVFQKVIPDQIFEYWWSEWQQRAEELEEARNYIYDKADNSDEDEGVDEDVDEEEDDEDDW